MGKRFQNDTCSPNFAKFADRMEGETLQGHSESQSLPATIFSALPLRLTPHHSGCIYPPPIPAILFCALLKGVVPE